MTFGYAKCLAPIFRNTEEIFHGRVRHFRCASAGLTKHIPQGFAVTRMPSPAHTFKLGHKVAHIYRELLFKKGDGIGLCIQRRPHMCSCIEAGF